jgi:adenylate cyclase class 2
MSRALAKNEALPPMLFEVEQKYRLLDPAVTERELDSLAVAWRSPEEQVDLYFAHPSRDFAQTDEALRIRRIGDESFVTYKGPKVGKVAKTRQELELPLAGGRPGGVQFALLLESLGFRRVAEVAKTRRPGSLHWNGRAVEVALDEVAGIGRFLEIELIAADDARDDAEHALQSLAQRLRLTQQEKRSYLALVLSSENP